MVTVRANGEKSPRWRRLPCLVLPLPPSPVPRVTAASPGVYPTSLKQTYHHWGLNCTILMFFVSKGVHKRNRYQHFPGQSFNPPRPSPRGRHVPLKQSANPGIIAWGARGSRVRREPLGHHQGCHRLLVQASVPPGTFVERACRRRSGASDAEAPGITVPVDLLSAWRLASETTRLEGRLTEGSRR